MDTIAKRKLRSVRIKIIRYRHLEDMAKEENISVNNLIETLLAKASGFYEPNKKTKKAIEEASREKLNLNKYTDVNNLFEDLAND